MERKLEDQMNIIFVTIAYPNNLNESNIYSDLMEEFASQGHNIYVVCSTEKRYNKETYLDRTSIIKILRVKTGNIKSNPNLITKGLALLSFQGKIIASIKKYLPSISFDLILYSTPPIQYNKIIKYLRSKSQAYTYLLLKDIFPQNAIDLNLINKWNPIYYYFRKKEKETYKLSDRIGCMSEANMKYILKHNPFISPNKVEVCPNSLRKGDFPDENERKAIRNKIRNSLFISEEDLLLIYGGNLGIAQGLDFLLNIFDALSNCNKVKILIVGDGTEYSKIKLHLNNHSYHNVTLLTRISPDLFKEMLFAADFGLIFLDSRFTIPNFPSRLTSYLNAGLPVISCTDNVCDVGEIIEKEECGFKVLSGDIERFISIIKYIQNNPLLLKQMSINAKLLFEKEYTTIVSYNIIMKNLNELYLILMQ